MENNQNQTPETEKPSTPEELIERVTECHKRQKAIDAKIEGTSEQAKKNANLQSEIFDCLYKIEQIGSAASYLLSVQPEYIKFDPVPLVDAILDYSSKIEKLINGMRF